jgi:hypothetical protein
MCIGGIPGCSILKGNRRQADMYIGLRSSRFASRSARLKILNGQTSPIQLQTRKSTHIIGFGNRRDLGSLEIAKLEAVLPQIIPFEYCFWPSRIPSASCGLIMRTATNHQYHCNYGYFKTFHSYQAFLRKVSTSHYLFGHK